MIAPTTIVDRSEWPPKYVSVFQWRQQQLLALRASPVLMRAALAYYAKNPVDFIQHWVDTVDPRNAGIPGKLVRMPFVLFERQKQLVDFVEECKKDQESGLVEKVRTAGATWTCCAYSVHQWRFVAGTAIGWGSRKEQLVDKIGDMDSIFEKMRSIIRGLPPEFLPVGFDPYSDKHVSYMRIVNPENGATITGEAGDNIGRGGRKTLYFKDESAHYERPDKIEASLSENTRVQIDISSVNGPNNPFHRKRENGEEWQPGRKCETGKTRVFIFDVFDHPANTKEWYVQRKKKFEDDGLAHVFAQEIDRNYSASNVGIIIPAYLVNAAIDAHLKLGIDPDQGAWSGALDVADGLTALADKNAFTGRRGIVLRVADEWSAIDTGVTTRRAAGLAMGWGLDDIHIQYDAIGVGAGVKAEVNRLQYPDDETKQPLMPRNLIWRAWNAGAKVVNPLERIIPGDTETPRNVDFFGNFKAQAWWSVFQRFYRTWRALNDPTFIFDPETLISIDSKIPFLNQIKKELSQATKGENTNLKMIVNKTPEGTRSPNIADSIIMNYFPAPTFGAMAVVGTSSDHAGT